MNQPVLQNHRRRTSFGGLDHSPEMMHEASLPARRRFELIRLAQRQGQLSVADLSSQFGVSSDTIRRDLDLLSLRGFVRRTHGGAVPADYLGQGDPAAAPWVDSRIAEKTRIAQCASELIQDGENLILNGGSTTRLFAFELGGKRNLTVVTNALGIPNAVPRQAVRDVTLSKARRARVATCGQFGRHCRESCGGVCGAGRCDLAGFEHALMMRPARQACIPILGCRRERYGNCKGPVASPFADVGFVLLREDIATASGAL